MHREEQDFSSTGYNSNGPFIPILNERTRTFPDNQRCYQFISEYAHTNNIYLHNNHLI